MNIGNKTCRAVFKAKKAIYGFAEAARQFWKAVRAAFLSAGFEQSKLESALFYKKESGELVAIACTHVDDVMAALKKDGKDHLHMVKERFQFFIITTSYS